MKSEIIKQALLEIESEVREGDSVNNPNVIMDMLRLRHARKKTEIFGALLLDQKNRIIEEKILEKGIENRCHVYIKSVVRTILKTEATGIIFFHNHPSDTLSFSDADIQLTKKMKTVFDILEIRLLDHIMVCRKGAISMIEERGEI